MQRKSALVAGMMVCCGVGVSAKADLVITEVMSSSAHSSGTNNGDWFELTNTGPSSVDLSTFSWDDNSAAAGSAGFGGITSIAAGESVIVSQETVGTESSFLSDWGLTGSGVQVATIGNTDFQNFSSTGDEVNVYDGSSTLVASVSFSTATQGFTFEWDTSGNSLGLSVAGENGAYVAPSDGAGGAGVDVGSPGVVPEPAGFVLMGIGSLLLARRRQS